MNDNIIIIIIIIQSTNQDVKKAHESWSARWNDCDRCMVLNSDWERKWGEIGLQPTNNVCQSTHQTLFFYLEY